MINRLFFLLPVFIYIGCVGGPPEAPGPPEGWDGTADRWWRAGVDTAVTFRDLGTFDAMGIPLETVVYGQGERTIQQQVVNTVREKFFKMYQNHPEVVDSLFDEHVLARVMNLEDDADSYEAQARAKQKDAYIVLNRHFRQPRPQSKLVIARAAPTYDPDVVPVIFPDSIRSQGIGGRVQMQLYLNPEGRAVAVQRFNSIHPFLDDMAMKTVTRMQWHPVYLHGEPIYGWALFNINFKRSLPEGSSIQES